MKTQIVARVQLHKRKQPCEMSTRGIFSRHWKFTGGWMDLLNERNLIFQKSAIPYAALHSQLCSSTSVYIRYLSWDCPQRCYHWAAKVNQTNGFLCATDMTEEHFWWLFPFCSSKLLTQRLWGSHFPTKALKTSPRCRNQLPFFDERMPFPSVNGVFQGGFPSFIVLIVQPMSGGLLWKQEFDTSAVGLHVCTFSFKDAAVWISLFWKNEHIIFAEISIHKTWWALCVWAQPLHQAFHYLVLRPCFQIFVLCCYLLDKV